MQVNNSSANAAQLRRNIIESQRSEKSSTKATESEAQSAPENNGSPTDGQVLKEIGDEASDAFGLSLKFPKIDLTEHLEELAAKNDERAAELFEGVDTANPTLTTTEGGFDVNASQGPEGSTYLDLGNDTQVFVVPLANGFQAIYPVEDGKLGERLPSNETVNIGNDIHVSTGKSANGDSEITFQQGGPSLSNLWDRPSTMTLNSDSGMLTTKNHERGGFLNLSVSTEVNSFDIQSGDQIVTDGVADLAKMTPEQQFDYYSSTPQGAEILNVEGNHYNTDTEKRILVARAQYVRGEADGKGNEGPDLFNDFTPNRASLTGDDLAAYDAAVEDLMNEMREEGVYRTGGDDQGGAIDESLLYMTASAAVEAYADSPDVLEAAKGDLDKYIFSTDNADSISVGNGGSSAGYYSSSRSEVQFSLEHFVRDYANPNDNYEIVPHEFAHALDNTDGKMDGLPPGLSEEQTATFTAERQRLFEEAYPGGFDMTVSELDYKTEVVDNNGLRNYAFYNEREFLAVTTELFLSSDANAEVLKGASPELYNLYREYYNREDLPEA